MQYRTMPKSDEKLSILGFGCMRLPTRIGGMTSSFIDKEKQPKDLKLELNDFLINGYSDRKKARTLLESDSRPLSTPIKMCHRYFNTGFTTLIFKSKEHFDELKEHFDKYFKGKSAKEIDSLSIGMDLSIYEGVRYMNNTEREYCQNIPKEYTDSLTQNEAACVLGDGWTCDVIAYILGGIA